MISYLRKTFRGSVAEFHALVSETLEKSGRMFVVTANPETFMKAESDAGFDKVLSDPETVIVPDGIGVVKGMNGIGLETHGRVTGVELAEHLLSEASRLKKRVWLYGARPEVSDALAEVIARDYPDAVVAGRLDGYGHDSDAVFEQIAADVPDVVLVALGVPVQELLIHRHLDKFSKGIFVGVGGSFDVLSGTKKRAPALFVKLNLEWLYRIVCEPKRIGRFYQSNVKFFSVLRKEKKKEKKAARNN